MKDQNISDKEIILKLQRENKAQVKYSEIRMISKNK